MCPLIKYIRVTGWIKQIEWLLDLSVENTDRKSSTIVKILQSKGLELTQLKYSGKLFVNESLSHKNQ